MINLRVFQQLKYKDPRSFLIKLRQLELEIANTHLPPKVKRLRTNSLKRLREMREAALFCYGMTQKIGHIIYMTDYETSDYDFIAMWVAESTQHFSPVQIKEWNSHSSASLQQIIDELLLKYVDSKDLTVVIHLNHSCKVDLNKLIIPSLNIAGLWVFGAVSQDQLKWNLVGDLLTTPDIVSFNYPS